LEDDPLSGWSTIPWIKDNVRQVQGAVHSAVRWYRQVHRKMEFLLAVTTPFSVRISTKNTK